MEIVSDQIEGPARCRFDEKGHTGRFAFFVVISVRQIAIAIDDLAGKAERGLLTERNVQCGRRALVVIIAIFEGSISAELR